MQKDTLEPRWQTHHLPTRYLVDTNPFGPNYQLQMEKVDTQPRRNRRNKVTRRRAASGVAENTKKGYAQTSGSKPQSFRTQQGTGNRSVERSGPASCSTELARVRETETSVTEANTSARSADIVAIPRRSTTAPSDLLKIITPLRWQAWEEELENAGILDKYCDIVYNISHGFPSGVSSTITKTFIPPNHASSRNNPQPIQDYIDKELANGRYSGPFTKDQLESIIGPFRSSPLGAVPKPGTTKIRLVQDLSFPRDDPYQPSVNSEIDSGEFPCEWGSFTDAFLLVARAPPGTQAAVFDVEAAFRRVPMRPEDQPHVIVMWLTQLFVDHCFCFGGASSPGIFGRIADAIVEIFQSWGIKDILKWVDDFVFFRYGNRHRDGSYEYEYGADLIWNIGLKLGWPWAPEKFTPFSTIFSYIGFTWDLDAKAVQVPEKKKEKYLLKISAWTRDYKATLEEVESLSGTLQHVSLAVPEGRSHLPCFWRFKKDFSEGEEPELRPTQDTAICYGRYPMVEDLPLKALLWVNYCSPCETVNTSSLRGCFDVVGYRHYCQRTLVRMETHRGLEGLRKRRC